MGADDSQSSGAGPNSFAANHSTPPWRKLNVAPTDGSTKFNAIRIPLIPVACWKLNDPAFAFDSSFVSPNFRGEFVPAPASSPDQPSTPTDAQLAAPPPADAPLTTLSAIVAAKPGCPVALFGHCDPAGTDTLNKTLGDRRAIAIYALVTRQPDLWVYLHDNAEVGDKWDLRMTQTMLASVPDGQGNPYYAGTATGVQDADTTDAVKRFQTDAGLSADGDPGSQTRKALYGAYMDWLCTPSGDSTRMPFRMQQSDFLGGTGAQPGDLPKMSLQSCGKFNPIVLLTSDEMGGVDTSNETDGASKTQRNADDAPNRRVIMFFFEKGTTVDSSLWPCPKVKESNAACNDAFWPDGDQRRKNGPTQRLYKDTRDTMACRFYDRFARRSPCESGEKGLVLEIHLLDALGKPMTNVPYRVNIAGKVKSGISVDGWVTQAMPPDMCPATCHVEWGPKDRSGAFTYQLDIFVECGEGDDQATAEAKLHNLGFTKDMPLALRVERFQARYESSVTGLASDGTIPAATVQRIGEVYADGLKRTSTSTSASPSATANA
jgi:hypothetical protein